MLFLGSLLEASLAPPWLVEGIDISLVLLLTYAVLLAIGEQRTLLMVRGLIVLMLAAVFTDRLGLVHLSFVLERLVLGSAVAMAVVFQAEFRQFLERLGRGDIRHMFTTSRRYFPKPDSTIDEIVDAVKELSQNRTGALIVMETGDPIDERFFSVPGVVLNAEVSKELLQTIFQTSTLLHDGALLIRGSRVMAAGVILPLSERVASRQLGTRHRAAMGITERVEGCICIVVSEETGSISLAERRTLNRPLTSSKLKEILEEKFSPVIERESVAPTIGRLGRQLGSTGWGLFQRALEFGSSDSKREK
ncbi:MAG: TIGR00159 family protein [Kamptonema sp. SIO4C4]|nr:TIGR00159 family protein [Kamptonema sp. SIO4C4]